MYHMCVSGWEWGTKVYVFIMRQGRGSDATEAVFCLQAKNPFIPGCVQRINI